MTIFADTKISTRDKAQMENYYMTVINAPDKFKIRFAKNDNEQGFEMKYKNKKIWHSKWQTKEEIIEESLLWKNFKLQRIVPSKNKRAYFVILEKQ